MQKTNKSGFTLVELIVVITILAILGTIAFISLQGYSSSARNSRRISDVNNIKTSLELFILNSGIYPTPDNYETVSYGGDDLWYQGIIGDNVTKNLSKNLPKKPTDPLYEINYTYSITNTKKEYELLAFYESNIAQNQIFNQANAATNVIPKILGNYNQLYVKSANYIVPTPSIINAEVNGTGMILNENNIKSQILSEGENIPNVNIGGIETQTGKLEILLSVYTGSITKETTSTGKILAIEKIQQAYSGTTLSNNGIYKYILGKTSNDDKLGLAETVLLNNNFTFTTNDDGGVELVLVNGECGNDDGKVLITEPTNLCIKGNGTGLTDGGVGGLYEWDCEGENGGITESCSANHISCTNITSSIVNYWKFNDLTPSDDFTGTSFNTDRWATMDSTPGVASVSNNYYKGDLVISSGWGRSCIRSKKSLVGDFEVSLDTQILSKTDNNFTYGELIVWINGLSVALVRPYASGGGYYNSVINSWGGTIWAQNNSSTISSLANIGNTGKVKIKRIGNVLTTLYYNGSRTNLGTRSSWGTGDVVIDLCAIEASVSSSQTYSTWIDNFNVINGEKVTDSKSAKNGSLQCVTGLCTWTTGKIGNALSFNGTSNYINLGTTGIANPKVNTSGSISFWAKTTAANGVIYSEQEATPSGTLFITNNSFNLHNGTSFVTVNSPIAITSGVWYHYVATWDSTQMSLYVNGVGASTPYTGTTQNFTKPMIGAYYSGGALAGYFNGTVDDFSIYNRVLTQAEITKIYNDGLSGNTVCSY